MVMSWLTVVGKFEQASNQQEFAYSSAENKIDSHEILNLDGNNKCARCGNIKFYLGLLKNIANRFWKHGAS